MRFLEFYITHLPEDLIIIEAESGNTRPPPKCYKYRIYEQNSKSPEKRYQTGFIYLKAKIVSLQDIASWPNSRKLVEKLEQTGREQFVCIKGGEFYPLNPEDRVINQT